MPPFVFYILCAWYFQHYLLDIARTMSCQIDEISITKNCIIAAAIIIDHHNIVIDQNVIKVYPQPPFLNSWLKELKPNFNWPCKFHLIFKILQGLVHIPAAVVGSPYTRVLRGDQRPQCAGGPWHWRRVLGHRENRGGGQGQGCWEVQGHTRQDHTSARSGSYERSWLLNALWNIFFFIVTILSTNIYFIVLCMWHQQKWKLLHSISWSDKL